MFDEKCCPTKNVNTRLEYSSNSEEYVKKICTTPQNLKDLDFKVRLDQSFLLTGLPDKYKHMILGLESSGTVIKGKSVKNKYYSMCKAVGQGQAIHLLFSEKNRN